jgi:hypothetical protein
MREGSALDTYSFEPTFSEITGMIPAQLASAIASGNASYLAGASIIEESENTFLRSAKPKPSIPY